MTAARGTPRVAQVACGIDPEKTAGRQSSRTAVRRGSPARALLDSGNSHGVRVAHASHIEFNENPCRAPPIGAYFP
ncbi:hypothetical protein SANTM175S_04958 [Streptomyces antimycoticus]